MGVVRIFYPFFNSKNIKIPLEKKEKENAR
jgi:hypothetical protein